MVKTQFWTRTYIWYAGESGHCKQPLDKFTLHKYNFNGNFTYLTFRSLIYPFWISRKVHIRMHVCARERSQCFVHCFGRMFFLSISFAIQSLFTNYATNSWNVMIRLVENMLNSILLVLKKANYTSMLWRTFYYIQTYLSIKIHWINFLSFSFHCPSSGGCSHLFGFNSDVVATV